MPRTKLTFETVREMALRLPNVEESTAYGSPALKVGGKLLACIPTHRSAEPNSLAVRVGFDDRDELLSTVPEAYYLKDHYLNYPVVLVRLSRISSDALEELVAMSWRFVTSERPARKRKAARKAPH